MNSNDSKILTKLPKAVDTSLAKLSRYFYRVLKIKFFEIINNRVVQKSVGFLDICMALKIPGEILAMKQGFKLDTEMCEKTLATPTQNI